MRWRALSVVARSHALAAAAGGMLFLWGRMGPSGVSAQDRFALVRDDQEQVPVEVFRPSGGRCTGVAVVSHGLAATDDSYRYLVRPLLERGWLVELVSHPESGMGTVLNLAMTQGLKAGLASLLTDGAMHHARLMDVEAARRWGVTQCRSSRSLLIGHALGAATAMIEAGAENNLGVSGEDGFTAYVWISPPGVGSMFPEHAWQRIRKPAMEIVGTVSEEVEGGGDWQARLEPYRDMPGAGGCKWLGVIDGVGNRSFSGYAGAGKAQPLTAATVAAFADSLASGSCALPQPLGGIDLRAK